MSVMGYTLCSVRVSAPASILHVGKRYAIAALKLYADGKIVAARPALPAGFSRMPGPLFAGNELDDFAIPPDEEVSRNLEAAKSRIIGMSLEIKPEFVNSSITPSPPNSSGGRLMLWITSRLISHPAGRSSKLGEGIKRMFSANRLDLHLLSCLFM